MYVSWHNYYKNIIKKCFFFCDVMIKTQLYSSSAVLVFFQELKVAVWCGFDPLRPSVLRQDLEAASTSGLVKIENFCVSAPVWNINVYPDVVALQQLCIWTDKVFFSTSPLIVLVIRVTVPRLGVWTSDGRHELVFDLLLGVFLQVRLYSAALR